MSRIQYADEIEGVLEEAAYRGEISLKEKNKMEILFKSMVNSPKIAAYFKRNVTVLNEQSIVVPKSKILRPDRIVIDEDKIIVIDYKTGEKDQNIKFKSRIILTKLHRFLIAPFRHFWCI